VFGQLFNHSDFKDWQPVSAGFISIGIGEDQNPDCTCFGESTSLKLRAHPDDTMLAKRQILGFNF
jgi:hypothetical protein